MRHTLHLRVLLLFVALTAVLTWPQLPGFASMVPYHTDPYFSMWRLGWVAHAIHTSPRTLFDANIFYPSANALGYSDAMLLPGAVAAPFYWAGVHPVPIYNALLFAAFALSGYAAFLLARTLTGSTAAALVAGMVFAFAPYRFCHYMHLELQMVFWTPLGLLLIHRLIAGSRLRDGVLLGLVVAAQLLSSVYVGIFALVYFATAAAALLAVSGAPQPRRLTVAVGAGALVATVIVLPYALAYGGAEREVGLRGLDEVSSYSASLTHYLSAPAMSRLYGWTASGDIFWADEMNLFPGVIACVLALVGVAAGRGRVRFVYLAALIVSVELTRGSSSPVYLWLFEHVEPFRALRSPARFDTVVNLSLGVLAAYGAAFLLSRTASRYWRVALATALVAGLAVEYAVSPPLAPAFEPTRVDALLARRPPSVIVELPLMSRRGVWGSFDWVYMYQSIGHFQKMLNGYSGHAPASFYRMREAMRFFPDDASMRFLQDLGVDYVVVRAGFFEPEQRAPLFALLDGRPDLVLEAKWLDEPERTEAIYRVVRRP